MLISLPAGWVSADGGSALPRYSTTTRDKSCADWEDYTGTIPLSARVDSDGQQIPIWPKGLDNSVRRPDSSVTISEGQCAPLAIKPCATMAGCLIRVHYETSGGDHFAEVHSIYGSRSEDTSNSAYNFARRGSDEYHPLDIYGELGILGEMAPGVSILNYWPIDCSPAQDGPQRGIGPQLVLRAGNQVTRVTVDVSNNSQYSLSGR